LILYLLFDRNTIRIETESFLYPNLVRKPFHTYKKRIIYSDEARFYVNKPLLNSQNVRYAATGREQNPQEVLGKNAIKQGGKSWLIFAAIGYNKSVYFEIIDGCLGQGEFYSSFVT